MIKAFALFQRHRAPGRQTGSSGLAAGFERLPAAPSTAWSSGSVQGVSPSRGRSRVGHATPGTRRRTPTYRCPRTKASARRSIEAIAHGTPVVARRAGPVARRSVEPGSSSRRPRSSAGGRGAKRGHRSPRTRAGLADAAGRRLAGAAPRRRLRREFEPRWSPSWTAVKAASSFSATESRSSAERKRSPGAWPS